MAGRRPRTLALLVPGLVCLGISAAAAVQLYGELMRDFYWTPLETAPDLDGARDDVEVWLDGDLLQRQAESGAIRDSQGRLIDPERIRVRMNRRDRIQRSQLALAAAAAAAGIAFLVSAALTRERRRSEPVAGVEPGPPPETEP